MHLTIVTPTELLEDREVEKVRAEGITGSFTVLPRHIDMATALAPGIIEFVGTEDQTERYVAADEGVFVKQGSSVSISILEGTPGVDLAELRQTLEATYEQRDERERRYRTSATKMETELARSFLEYQRQ